MHMRFIPFLVAAALAIAALPVAAHHGWGGNGEEEFELTGTVESGVSLAGPHATMKVRAEGQVWDGGADQGERIAAEREHAVLVGQPVHRAEEHQVPGPRPHRPAGKGQIDHGGILRRIGRTGA